jgi:hypothetical protein
MAAAASKLCARYYRLEAEGTVVSLRRCLIRTELLHSAAAFGLGGGSPGQTGILLAHRRAAGVGQSGESLLRCRWT